MPTIDVKQAFWTPANVALVTAGQWLREPDDPVAALAGVSIDTRTIQPGEVFIAIKGENFDGHGFVEQAFANGAAIAIVTGLAGGPRGPALQVKDTIAALRQLARAWRDVLADQGCKVIAVAGSNGKTTTRHLIHRVLTHGGLTGTQSPKSFNNHLGVPLTLLGASPEHDFVACEIGTNHPGEVAALAHIARPDLAVITAIGAEHLAFFGSIENVAREEYSLLDYVQPGGASFTPRGNLEPYTGPLALCGTHNRGNAAYAAAVARWFGLNEDTITEALRTVEPMEGRTQLLRFGDVTVIHDAYNANPDSVRAAIEAFDESWHRTDRRGVFVFGDMLELGTHAAPAHREVGYLVAKIRPVIELFITIGTLAGHAAEETRKHWPEAPAAALPAWSDDAPDRIVEMLCPGDIVLIKASRAMRLERLIPAIEKRFASNSSI